MKKVLFIVFLLLVMVIPSQAGLYVLYNASTEEIVDVSPWDDAVIQVGQEKVFLDEEFDFVQHVQFYDLKNGKIKFNAQRFNDYEIDKAQKEQDHLDKKSDMDAIDKKMKEVAFDALKAEGYVFKKVKKADL